ncbi:Cysteine_synthase A [Hexamita inflata]|uniref:Cysteine synthase n=1 Tax=Hexamita inflata TaxID=28002 RepID=A0AA86Q078_9EUKA|nr:Cysteine synthase A [Hexamita inflata]
MSLITEIIGNTPLVRLQRLNQKGRVFVKLESRNPGGSVKDRAAFQMVKDLLDQKKITKDTLLIEPTSGNTGVGLCMVAASLGMKMVLTMPSTMTIERQKLMKAYGATVVLTEGPLGMKGAIAKAEELQKETPNSIIPSQFTNQSNPRAHELTTGPELLKQIEQFAIKPAYFVSGVGTGGTITGVAKVLKPIHKDLKVIAVEPNKSPVLRGGKHSGHKIGGIGAGFIPDVLDQKAYDAVEGVDDEVAFEFYRKLAREEGILVGVSSAAAISVAIKYADEHDCDVIVVAPDTGERYLSVDGLI